MNGAAEHFSLAVHTSMRFTCGSGLEKLAVRSNLCLILPGLSQKYKSIFMHAGYGLEVIRVGSDTDLWTYFRTHIES